VRQCYKGNTGGNVVSLVDLHIHSKASDGKFSPGDVVRKAASLGLRVISLSDHDTVSGIAEALSTAASYSELRVIPGVEISTDVPRGEIHILGYFIDHTDSNFLSRLDTMRSSRLERARKMIAKLAGLGIKIEWSRVEELAAGSTVGRPHVAQAMMEKGYIGTFKEAFDRYIGRNGPAYVERDKMTPAGAVELIKKAGGLPVFAHPLTFDDYATMTGELVPAGLIGIETYYKNFSPDEIKKVLAMAEEYDLIPTGGSDFHGIETSEVMIGGVEVPLDSAERLINMAGRR
jgi:predicted metal-dependent phosphoesterase TrpH